jgi:ribonuclease P protein component
MDFSSAAGPVRAEPFCAHGVRAVASDSRSRPAGSVPGRSKRSRLGFGAERRLARSAEFERLLASGARRRISGYTFYLGRRADGPPRLGILVSRRHSSKATIRNGIKRCIREAFRLEQARLGALDVLVRPPYGARASASMILCVRQLLGRLDE